MKTTQPQNRHLTIVEKQKMVYYIFGLIAYFDATFFECDPIFNFLGVE